MYDYAALASGATLTAAELIATGRAGVAFNPSGGYHHAHAARAAGFCYLNDVVLGCIRLADAGMKVMFVDVDAHHADGVQEAFYARRDVMTVSFHQDGRTLFPGTGSASELGAGEGLGLSVNLPMPVGTFDAPFLEAFREIVPPLIGAFAPDTLVLELGMDGLAGDPLAELRLTNNAHAEVVGTLVDAGKPLLVTGGGGYNPRATARGWALAWSIMCGADAGADLSLGLGGVMLESTEWQGGLRDRALAIDERQRGEVEGAIRATVDEVKKTVFPLHGL
jgi:acetoin utilization protein AcuC